MIDPVVGLATLATVVVHREREREAGWRVSATLF
jgi:hypothetical protein